MHPVRRRSAVMPVVVVVALSLGVLGCGDGGDSASGPAPPSTDTPAETRETTTATPNTTSGTTAAPTTEGTPPVAPAPSTTADAATTVPPPSVEDLLARGNVSVAHSGGALEGPDETLYAFSEARKNGADVLEMNLLLSSDGELVVIHDPTVDRTTDRTGNVSALTAAELNALDAAYWWVRGVGRPKDADPSAYEFRGVRTGAVAPPEGYTADDFGVPTLAQVVDRFPDAVFDLEMEEEAGEAIIEELATFIEERQLQDRVVVASQSAAFMDAFIQRMPGVAASPGLQRLLEFKMAPGPIPGYRIAQIPPRYGDIEVTEADLAVLRDNGIAYWFYMGDLAQETAESYQALLDRGASGLIVDRPSVLAEILDAGS